MVICFVFRAIFCFSNTIFFTWYQMTYRFNIDLLKIETLSCIWAIEKWCACVCMSICVWHKWFRVIQNKVIGLKRLFVRPNCFRLRSNLCLSNGLKILICALHQCTCKYSAKKNHIKMLFNCFESFICTIINGTSHKIWFIVSVVFFLWIFFVNQLLNFFSGCYSPHKTSRDCYNSKDLNYFGNQSDWF